MKIFAKQTNCPASSEVLSYVENSLRPLAMQKVARHCSLCDFCGAEAQLFSKYQPSEKDHTAAPAPVLITVLGVSLPVRRPVPLLERRAA